MHSNNKGIECEHALVISDCFGHQTPNPHMGVLITRVDCNGIIGMQRTAAANSLTPRSSSHAGSDLECTVFPLPLASGLSADSLELSLGGSAGSVPIREHIHSAASEAQALAQEAAQLKAQAQNYQVSQ